MKPRRRSLALAVTVALVVVVVLGVVVVVVVGLPVVVAMGVALLALVAGVGSRVAGLSRHRRGRPRPFPHRSAERPAASPWATRWATQWEGSPSVDAVPLARSGLSAALDDWDLTAEARDDVLLVVTELLSNAVEHADGPVRLAAGVRNGCVRVEVHDTAAAPPRPLPPDPSAGRGRGLHVVGSLSADWGWTDEPDGKVVWADVPHGLSTRSGTDHPDDR